MLGIASKIVTSNTVTRYRIENFTPLLFYILTVQYNP